MRRRRIVLAAVMAIICKAAVAQPVVQTNPPQASGADTGVNATHAPAHPVTEEQVKEYMALTGTLTAMHSLTGQMVSAMRTTSVPYLPASFWDDMTLEFQRVDFVKYLIPVYQQFISTEDMAEALRFYRSPAGQRILATQSPITEQIQPILRKVGEEIGERVYEKHKDEIDAAKAKYDAKPSKPEIDFGNLPK